jgi:hypothetical protein
VARTTNASSGLCQCHNFQIPSIDFLRSYLPSICLIRDESEIDSCRTYWIAANENRTSGAAILWTAISMSMSTSMTASTMTTTMTMRAATIRMMMKKRAILILYVSTFPIHCNSGRSQRRPKSLHIMIAFGQRQQLLTTGLGSPGETIVSKLTMG